MLNMSIHSRFSNFISYRGAIWRILTISVTASLCSTSQMKMLNEYDLNQIPSVVDSWTSITNMFDVFAITLYYVFKAMTPFADTLFKERL